MHFPTSFPLSPGIHGVFRVLPITHLGKPETAEAMRPSWRPPVRNSSIALQVGTPMNLVQWWGWRKSEFSHHKNVTGSSARVVSHKLLTVLYAFFSKISVGRSDPNRQPPCYDCLIANKSRSNNCFNPQTSVDNNDDSNNDHDKW